MLISSICKETVLLQAIVILMTNGICQCEKTEALINLRPGPDTDVYIQAEILHSNFQIFQEAFMNKTTMSVSLKYRYELQNQGTYYYIIDIQKQSNGFSFLLFPPYFRCSINQSESSILCIKMTSIFCIFSVINYCPDGFRISWLYEGEYLISEHLHDSTDTCLDGSKITCYTLNNVSSTIKTTSATKIPTAKIPNANKTTTESPTETTEKLISTSIKTSNPTNNTFASTTFSRISSPESSPIDSTAVIACSVTAGVVIAAIVVIIIIVACVKKKAKQEAGRNGAITNSEQQMTVRFSGRYGHDQQMSNLPENKHGKSTVNDIRYDEQNIKCYGTNTNSYTNTGTLWNDTYQESVFYSISDSDCTDIDEYQSSNLPDSVIPADKNDGSYYCTIRNDQSNNMSNSVTSDLEDGSYEHYSASKELNHKLSEFEYETENKNVGFKNISEIKEYTHCASEHEYNNAQKDNKTIGTNEPAKNVYSKLRETIRNFEHTYGDVGVSIEEREDNSTTLADDSVYFNLEAEAQC